MNINPINRSLINAQVQFNKTYTAILPDGSRIEVPVPADSKHKVLDLKKEIISAGHLYLKPGDLALKIMNKNQSKILISFVPKRVIKQLQKKNLSVNGALIPTIAPSINKQMGRESLPYAESSKNKPKRSKKKLIWLCLSILLLVVCAFFMFAMLWRYQQKRQRIKKIVLNMTSMNNMDTTSDNKTSGETKTCSKK